MKRYRIQSTRVRETYLPENILHIVILILTYLFNPMQRKCQFVFLFLDVLINTISCYIDSRNGFPHHSRFHHIKTNYVNMRSMIGNISWILPTRTSTRVEKIFSWGEMHRNTAESVRENTFAILHRGIWKERLDNGNHNKPFLARLMEI